MRQCPTGRCLLWSGVLGVALWWILRSRTRRRRRSCGRRAFKEPIEEASKFLAGAAEGLIDGGPLIVRAPNSSSRMVWNSGVFIGRNSDLLGGRITFLAIVRAVLSQGR